MSVDLRDSQQDDGLDNLALVLHEPLKMQLERLARPPPPKPNEVTLATHTVGICGSDVKYYQTGAIGPYVLRAPMVLGHETSALVRQVGSQVSHLKPGDRVAVEVGVPCARCATCRAGSYNLCGEMAFAATPPVDGTLRQLFNHPADFCYKLPAEVSLEEGALLEPLAVAVHACRRAPVQPGQSVLVCGAGAVGLLCMMTARAFGATHVLVTDTNPRRLELAKQLGANETLLVEPGAQTGAQLAERARALQPGGPEVALECSGAESSLELAIRACRPAAQLVCVGCLPERVSLPLGLAAMQEVDIKGVFRYRSCYPLALELVRSGKLALKALVTHRFELERAQEAFAACCRGDGVKILIQCSPPESQ